jgi:hypothetical protein
VEINKNPPILFIIAAFPFTNEKAAFYSIIADHAIL